MINVKILSKGFEISGHSNFAKKGQDIICAGVSAISQGIINCFDKNEVKVLEIKDGFIKFEIKRLSKKNKIKLNVFYTQIKSLASSYSKYVTIKE